MSRPRRGSLVPVALALAGALGTGCSFILDFGGEVEDGPIDAAEPVFDGAPEVHDGAPQPDADPADAGVSLAGCADEQREGFTDMVAQPDLAACSGGWSIGGVLNVAAPACSRAAGDDGGNPSGAGCNVTDLCAAGWHVCASPGEVKAASADDTCAGVGATAGLFFVSRQSGAGAGACGAGANDLFGCGTLGSTVVDAATCAPLDHFSGDLCANLGAPWACGADGTTEATAVTKSDATAGGVLCCRDP